MMILAGAVSACDSPALRCKNPNGSKSGDYDMTASICQKIGNSASMCYCWGAAEDYCVVWNGDGILAFTTQCQDNDGWNTVDC